jgi:hypothetical protein
MCDEPHSVLLRSVREKNFGGKARVWNARVVEKLLTLEQCFS